ncbi:hypothetical protein FACS1894132_02800 [Clostridia bacterium]|nr:hypothetical protein FACS1894132_02800 [Clostridia bacterium]
MKLIYINNHFVHKTEETVRLFFPMEKFEFEFFENTKSFKEKSNDEKDGDVFVFEIDNNKAVVSISINGRLHVNYEYFEGSSEAEYVICSLLYKNLVKITGKEQPWGMLTGIRPVALIQNCFDNNPMYTFNEANFIMDETYNEASGILREKYYVSREKFGLALSVAKAQAAIIEKAKGISIYISIPFCPSRCDYCSFISSSIDNAFKLIPEYVDLLCRELDFASERYKGKIDTVYIGGGTPTTLSPEQLDKLLKSVRKFNITKATEFTVECGRPDTITKEKLDVLKNYYVNRISINPQTFNQEALDAIGRKHTVGDIYKAYELAKDKFIINMDLIAGLPTDTAESFEHSIDECLKLQPDNITIHTLCLKRGAKMYSEQLPKVYEDMLCISNKKLYWGNYVRAYDPYYLYRQKNALGNLENVGYARDGQFCRYNIYTMSECQTVIAFGAGAITKIVNGTKIDRSANYKYPFEYIDNFNTVIERKLFCFEHL